MTTSIRGIVFNELPIFFPGPQKVQKQEKNKNREEEKHDMKTKQGQTPQPNTKENA